MWMFSFLVNWCLNRKREGRRRGKRREVGRGIVGKRNRGLYLEDEISV